jgi:hypothetical protein
LTVGNLEVVALILIKDVLTVDDEWGRVDVVDGTQAALVRIQRVFESVKDNISRQVDRGVVVTRNPTNSTKKEIQPILQKKNILGKIPMNNRAFG